MSRKFDLGFVLHIRRYRNTSALVEWFTRSEGRLCTIVKGLYRKNSTYQYILQPFNRLELSWSGQGELKTLTHATNAGVSHWLTGSALMGGLYLNELMVKLLNKQDPCLYVFEAYERTIEQMQQAELIEASLRRFEKILLKELGLGLCFQSVSMTGEPIVADLDYQFDPQWGLLPLSENSSSSSGGTIVSGKVLLALQADCYDESEIKRQAKYFLRAILAYCLEGKKLSSIHIWRRVHV